MYFENTARDLQFILLLEERTTCTAQNGTKTGPENRD
jgi:hypothetical protein